MRRAAWVSAAVVAATAASARPARGNGVNTHTWVTMRGVELLPDGELKKLLSSPDLEPILVNGSIFPDGGYAVQDGFGEIAHWEPFVSAYLAWLRDEIGPPYDRPEARRYVAFLFGVASHGMGDQIFDSMYMKAARGYDAVGWSDSLLESF